MLVRAPLSGHVDGNLPLELLPEPEDVLVDERLADVLCDLEGRQRRRRGRRDDGGQVARLVPVYVSRRQRGDPGKCVDHVVTGHLFVRAAGEEADDVLGVLGHEDR